jgi:hypothetical protein
MTHPIFCHAVQDKLEMRPLVAFASTLLCTFFRARFASLAPDLAHVLAVAANRFAALPADFGVETGAVFRAGCFAAFAAQSRIAFAPELTSPGGSAFLADFFVEPATVDGGCRYAAFPPSLFDGHLAGFSGCH